MVLRVGIFSILILTCFISCMDENPVMIRRIASPRKNGIKKISQYDARGKLEIYLTFEYDSNGNKSTVNQYTPDSILCGCYKLTYAKNGSIARQSIYRSVNGDLKLTGYHIFEYDADGNEVKMSVIDSARNLKEYYVTEYDINGRIFKESLFDASNNLMNYYLYNYNSEGINTSTYTYLASSKPDTYSNNQYDSDQHIIKETVYLGNQILYYLVYEY